MSTRMRSTSASFGESALLDVFLTRRFVARQKSMAVNAACNRLAYSKDHAAEDD
jgi:hypothetical protein